MKKTIVIQKIKINKNNFDMTDSVVVKKLYKHTGYYIIAIDNYFLVDEEIDKIQHPEIIILANNTKIETADIIATTTLDVDIVDGKYIKDIPVFGVTIDNNYNIQQINLSIDDIENDKHLNDIIRWTSNLAYWDFDKKLNINGKKYDVDLINKYMDSIRVQGYSNPLVLYADKENIKLYYYDIVAYIYNLIDCKKIPIRIITYQDIYYIKNISDSIYKAIKKIPDNKFYHVKDEKDMSPYMISNYSEKRDVLRKFINKEIVCFNEPVLLLNLDRLEEVIPFIFSEEYDSLNQDFVNRLKMHNYQKYLHYKDGHFEDNMSICESLYHYLQGYVFIDDSAFFVDNLSIDTCEIEEEIDFDPAVYSLECLEYIDLTCLIGEERNRINEGIKKYGNALVYNKNKNVLLISSAVNDLLYNDKKIVVLKDKVM